MVRALDGRRVISFERPVRPRPPFSGGRWGAWAGAGAGGGRLDGADMVAPPDVRSV